MSQQNPKPEKPETPPPPPTSSPDKPSPGIIPPPFEEVNYTEGPKIYIDDSCFEIKRGNLGDVPERDLV